MKNHQRNDTDRKWIRIHTSSVNQYLFAIYEIRFISIYNKY